MADTEDEGDVLERDAVVDQLLALGVEPGGVLLVQGHDANTTIHLAEVLAGVPYRVRRHCTVLEQGRAQRVEYGENDHCCQRFDFVDGWLRARNLQAEGLVGHAHARLARAQDIVAVTREELSGDPLLFLHPPEAECVECNEARSSIIA